MTYRLLPLIPDDYQEVPQADKPAMRALSAAVAARLEAASPWRPFVTRALLPSDVTKYKLGRGGVVAAADPFADISGPSALISGYWLNSTTHTATPPSDVTWTAKNTITPRELLALSTLNSETYMDAIAFDEVQAGAPLVDDELRYVDPIVAMHLAGALLRAENLALASGAASAADPFRGLASISGITTQAATANLVDDLFDAVGTLRAAKRPPNVIWVATNHQKKLRKLKAATGGSYLFAPEQPMQIDGVPIVALDGLGNSVGSFAYVADARQLVVLHRVMPNGMLVMLAESREAGTNFTVDRVTIRASERLDMNVVPGSAPSIVQITGVDAS